MSAERSLKKLLAHRLLFATRWMFGLARFDVGLI